MILHRRMQTVSKGIPGARSLHLDRDVGQKTPTCILTHRQASQGPRAQDSPGARTKGPATPRQPGLPTQPPPVLEHIEPERLQLTPLTAPYRLAGWVAFDRWYRCRTV